MPRDIHRHVLEKIQAQRIRKALGKLGQADLKPTIQPPNSPANTTNGSKSSRMESIIQKIHRDSTEAG